MHTFGFDQYSRNSFKEHRRFRLSSCAIKLFRVDRYNQFTAVKRWMEKEVQRWRERGVSTLLCLQLNLTCV